MFRTALELLEAAGETTGDEAAAARPRLGSATRPRLGTATRAVQPQYLQALEDEVTRLTEAMGKQEAMIAALEEAAVAQQAAMDEVNQKLAAVLAAVSSSPSKPRPVVPANPGLKTGKGWV